MVGRDFVRTGIPGLDELFLGGVTRHNSILVEGAPGTGKTTLALGFMCAGAAELGEPGIIVSFELDQAKLIRDAKGFDWNIEKLIADRRLKIVSASPEALFKELRARDSVLLEFIEDVGAKRLMIDGLTPLKLYAEAASLSFRSDLNALIEELTTMGVTTLVTAERDVGEGASPAHERYVFDTIVSLSRLERHRRVHRRLTIEKSRGQDFIEGSHTMEIVAGAGVQVYRRAQSRPKVGDAQPTSSERLSTGVPALDAMMGGGLYVGSITLVTGLSGTGKTVAGIQFLCSAATSGRKALLVSLDEHPAQILRNAQTLGFDLQRHVDEGRVTIHYESPLELELDLHFDRIVQLVEEKQIDCIVFDSVAVYEATIPEEVADFLYSLATFCKDRLVTAYFNYESPELLGVSQISEELHGSHLVDNIILLGYVEISTRLRRAITVPKVRGSRNVQVTREYVIGPDGISIVEETVEMENGAGAVPQLPFSAYYGLLSRSPTRQSPVIEEAITAGNTLPPGVIPRT